MALLRYAIAVAAGTRDHALAHLPGSAVPLVPAAEVCWEWTTDAGRAYVAPAAICVRSAAVTGPTADPRRRLTARILTGADHRVVTALAIFTLTIDEAPVLSRLGVTGPLQTDLAEGTYARWATPIRHARFGRDISHIESVGHDVRVDRCGAGRLISLACAERERGQQQSELY